MRFYYKNLFYCQYTENAQQNFELFVARNRPLALTTHTGTHTNIYYIIHTYTATETKTNKRRKCISRKIKHTIST